MSPGALIAGDPCPPRRPRRSPGSARGTGSRPWPAPRQSSDHPLLDQRRHGREGPLIEALGRPGRRRRGRPPPGLGSGATHGRAASTNAFERQLPDVLAVQVGQLLHVEEGGRVVDVLQPELARSACRGRPSPVARRGSSRGGPGSCGTPRPGSPGRGRTRRPPGRGAWRASCAASFTSIGRWAKSGSAVPARSASSAAQTRSPFGVVGRRSSPRMTWRDRHVPVVDHVGQHEERLAGRLHADEVLHGRDGGTRRRPARCRGRPSPPRRGCGTAARSVGPRSRPRSRQWPS